MYPSELVTPMKSELTNVGFVELTSSDQVINHFSNQKGTSLVVVNSVCGCAAGSARPGVLMALNQTNKKPDHLVTVFAGVDNEATQKVREYTKPFPPSSPAIALFKDGNLEHFIERHHIEGRSAEMIAEHLNEIFEEVG